MSARSRILTMTVGLALCAGCQQTTAPQATVPTETKEPMAGPTEPAVLKASYTATPLTLDGKLDDAVWTTATEYPLSLAADATADGKSLLEGGTVKLAWDDQFFYVGVNFVDSDVVAEGAEDQLHHYRMGDLAELFLKPDEQTWYWELYVTPRGKKTSFWFPGRGRLGLDSCFEYTCGLKVAAQVAGTLNNWEDRDTGWTGEMAMPIADLTARGEQFGPGSNWRILVARYNYSRYLPDKELSMAPTLSKASYHLHEEYGRIEFVK